MKLGGTIFRRSEERDRCTAVKPFSAGVDPVPVGILTNRSCTFHVGDIVSFTLILVVKMRLLPLLCTSRSTYVHALDSDSARSRQVLSVVFIPLQIENNLTISIPLDKLFL